MAGNQGMMQQPIDVKSELRAKLHNARAQSQQQQQQQQVAAAATQDPLTSSSDELPQFVMEASK